MSEKEIAIELSSEFHNSFEIYTIPEREITIEFTELSQERIPKNAEFIYIVKHGEKKKYKIINTKEKLKEYSSNIINYLERDLGILVTCECNDIYGAFHDVIFLEKFKIDYSSGVQNEDDLYLNFSFCYFIKNLDLTSAQFSYIAINDSTINRNFYVRFSKCTKLFINNSRFKNKITIKGSDFDNFQIHECNFEGESLFQEVDSQADFILDKIKVNSILDFVDCRFEGLSKFNQLEIETTGALRFSHCSFYRTSEIDFDKIDGKLGIYRTNFADKCYLEYELLDYNKYKPLVDESDYNKTKSNYFHVAEIYRSNGKIEQYLETFYYFKKYERLERRQKNKFNLGILDFLIEKSTKYYTSWTRTLMSMGFIMMVFFLFYCNFPYLLLYKDIPINSENLFVMLFEMIENSSFDFHILIRKFGNVFYFTMMTFTTVGYGDISPLSFMKVAAGIEGLMGIFFTSSFVVALSRKFLR